MSKEEDFVLIKDFISGNKKAFDALVLKHKNLVFTLCFRLLGNYEEAEDISQDVFIKTYKALNGFKFRSAFTTWLYTVAVNTCKNRLSSTKYKVDKKSKSLENNDCNENTYKLPSSDNNNPYNLLDAGERERQIMNAINTLPDIQKILVVLRDIEGRSYDEIRRITGMKLGTVKSKLCRAREVLKDKLRGVI